MTHLFNENRLSFSQLARREGIHPSTCWRWAPCGHKGHTLESYTIGARHYTTEEAFQRWLAKTNAKGNMRPHEAKVANTPAWLDQKRDQ